LPTLVELLVARDHILSELHDTDFSKVFVAVASYSDCVEVRVEKPESVCIVLVFVIQQEIENLLFNGRPLESIRDKNYSSVVIIFSDLIDVVVDSLVVFNLVREECAAIQVFQ